MTQGNAPASKREKAEHPKSDGSQNGSADPNGSGVPRQWHTRRLRGQETLDETVRPRWRFWIAAGPGGDRTAGVPRSSLARPIWWPTSCTTTPSTSWTGRIGVDAGHVSRYESGRITPCADALARLAETLNISIDHLLIDDIPRRPLHSAEDVLGDRLNTIAELGDDDLHLVTSFIDALVTKNRLRTLANNIS